jgi:hypothetical protein
LNFVANFCRVSRVVEETRNHYADPIRICIVYHGLLGFPVALLAQEVVQTQKFNYPLAGGGKFTIDDANGTIAIRC